MTEKEFAQIIGETKKIVLSAVNKHLFDRFYYAVDDVVQEVYLRAFKHLRAGKFKGEAELSTWIYTIGRNESLRMNEKLGREEKRFQKSVEHYIEQEEKQQNQLEQREDRAVEEIYETIEGLPLAYQDVMKLVARGYKEKQIAEKLGIKAGTVKSRASRGKEILKERLLQNKRGGDNGQEQIHSVNG